MYPVRGSPRARERARNGLLRAFFGHVHEIARNMKSVGQTQPSERPLDRSGDAAQTAARVLIVSPVRNEASHIARVAQAVAAQELAPASWIAIDDGSTDGTFEQLCELQRELPFLTVLRAPRELAGKAARDRLAQAVEIRNFNVALTLAKAQLDSYTHLMKLDGDIELPPHYLRVLMERFAHEPLLGIAGGVLVEPKANGAMRKIAIPEYHVHGALKCYTQACYGAIGGVQERLGWDTIDQTYARMRGFSTRSFPDLVSVHHRPLASADGALRGHARHGECAYIAHYDPLWMTLRSLKVARRRPRGASAAAFLYGYARAALRGVEQVPDPEYRSFTRRELRGRMLGAIGSLGDVREIRPIARERRQA
jgi:poly-beta-1,6-N-acetyl-D-glucosamine synthase